MKSIMVAIVFLFALSANVGTTFAEDGENGGYEQHEAKDHGDKDRHEHGDKDRERGERHGADRNEAGGHGHGSTGSDSGFWDWLPF